MKFIKCCNKKDHPEEHARCSKLIQIIIVAFLVLNIVWGLTETTLTIIINFLMNHKYGRDGFTNSGWSIRDITFIEHQFWELPSEALYLELTPPRLHMLSIREAINGNCSKIKPDSNKTIDDKCNSRIPEDNIGIFFCDIVEKPQIFRDAVQPLTIRWLLFNILYLLPCPLIILGLLWKSQRISIFIAYFLLQFFPVLVSFSIIFDLRVTYSYSLCSLDYLFDGFPFTAASTLIIILRMLLKVVELFTIAWNIRETQVTTKRKGFGVKSGNQNRVVPITSVRGELLEGCQNPENEISVVSSSATQIAKESDSDASIIQHRTSLYQPKRKTVDRKSINFPAFSKSQPGRKSTGTKPARHSGSSQLDFSLDDFGDEQEEKSSVTDSLMTSRDTSVASSASSVFK